MSLRFALALRRQQWKSRRPTTFNEKVRYKMARDGSALATLLNDKAHVKEYVRKRVGSEVLPACLGIYEHAMQIDWQALPREFVLKVNHASGGIIVVADIINASTLPTRRKKEKWGRYIVHPDKFDRAHANELLDDWLSQRYAQNPRAPIELAYRHIPPHIVIEELLSDVTDGQRTLPTQLMVHCIHSEPAEYVLTHRASDFNEIGQRRYLADEWPAGSKEWGIATDDAQKITQLCRLLSRDTDMVRVDWHLTTRGMVFNEMTNYPAAGAVPFTGHAFRLPHELDHMLGALWQVPASYAENKNAGLIQQGRHST